jgi:hypothetical protein
MVKYIFLLSLSINSAQADFFSSGNKFKSKLPQVTEKIQSLEAKTSSEFEEKFTQLIKETESIFAEEKEYCSGDLADSKGRVITKDHRQVCFRELKTNYLEAVDAIFNLKKKYLSAIHNQQLDRLSQIQSKIKTDLERDF